RYVVEICDQLKGDIFQKFLESDKFTTIPASGKISSLNSMATNGGTTSPCIESSVEAGSVRYAMKCLDKKRIKMKQGETLALNERIMLSLVSTG
ncbi:hypothetical protein OSTOST_19591, partial [Ostertagia ostertagi]